MELSNAQIRDSLNAIGMVRTDGVDDEGNPKARVFPNKLRKLDYALFQTGKALQAQYKAVGERTDARRKAAAEVVTVQTETKDEEGNPVTEQIERFPTIKAKRDFEEWYKGEMEEVVDIPVHKVTAKHILDAYHGEDEEGLLPDNMFPALYELEYLFEVE